MFTKRNIVKKAKTYKLHKEEDEEQKQNEDNTTFLNKKRTLTSNNNQFTTAKDNKTNLLEETFYKSTPSLISNNTKSNAVREIEIDTEQSKDAMAILQRKMKISKDKLSGKIDTNTYTGKDSTIIYNEKSERDMSRYKITGSLGPMRAPTNLRVNCRFDYAPGICKDYKETGYCGFGDSCVFLHDRGDYKSGWELEEEWNKMQKEKEKKLKEGHCCHSEDEDDSDKSKENDKCGICEGDIVEGVVTLCGHLFCEKCALERYQKEKRCAVCGENTKGVFNNANNVIEMIKKRKNKKEKKVDNKKEDKVDVNNEDEGNLDYLDNRNYVLDFSDTLHNEENNDDKVNFVREKKKKKNHFEIQNDWIYKSNYQSYD